VDARPRIFEDTLACSLLGDQADELVDAHRGREAAGAHAAMRVAMTARARYTEDRLSEAFTRGIRQCVILGAGLDSLAYRSRLVGELRIFEVDHPDTQAWKSDRLGAAAIAVPRAVTFVGVDFRVDSLTKRLADMGFDPGRPAFVTWIGVTQYLRPAAIGATLDEIGGLAPGTELILEYVVPEGLRDAAGQAFAEWFMPRAAASGEPWLSFLTPSAVARLLQARGLVVRQDVGRRDQIDPSLWRRTDELRPHELGRLAWAAAKAPASGA
jgi:methyltransferase (TIGR00027 family)